METKLEFTYYNGYYHITDTFYYSNLGDIEFHPYWNMWGFKPEDKYIVLNSDCLDQISAFLKKLQQEKPNG